MEEIQSGFHPVRGCVKRLKEHQEQIDTDFSELRARFAKGYPAVGTIPAVSAATLNAILASVVENAPARLRELKQQLADCLYWELRRHGEHICSGYEVSEHTIRTLYAEVNQAYDLSSPTFHKEEKCVASTPTRMS